MHPDLDGEQRVAGLRAVRKDRQLVGAHHEPLACGTIDR
jgi:hypothetical protein